MAPRIIPSSSASSFSLRRIAAAMSSRPSFRGGRGRRSYSDQKVVSGDSHFQSVRHTNSSFNKDSNSNSQNFNYRYNNYNNSSNSTRGYYENNGGMQFQPQIQSYNPRPAFNRGPANAKPRPPDFRIWEYAKYPPPRHSEQFIVLSYNILADYLANSHRKLYSHIPRRFMSWDWRKGNILFELNLWSPDIMCFQEVDRFHEFEEDLRTRGYNGIWKMRTGEPIDGCAIFWRASRFKLVYEECIEFNKHGMRDNVAQICVLESLIQNHTVKASSDSSGGPNRVVICNIHVLYNPRRGEIKLGQVRILLERAQSVSKKWDDAPVVLCGDFNCTPKSPLYNFISERKLDISELGRDNVSGQASAELHSSPRQYGNPRERSTGNVATPAMVQNNSVEGKPNTSLENQNASERISEDLCQPPRDETLLDVTNNFCNDLHYSGILSEQVAVNTSHNGEDFSTYSGLSAMNLSADKLQDEGQGDHSNKRTGYSRPAYSADQLASETEQDPEQTSSEAFIKQDTSSVLKPDLTSEPNNQDCRTDSFPSVDDSYKEMVEEDTPDKYNSNNSQSYSSPSTSCSEPVEKDMPRVKSEPGPTSMCEASDLNTSLAFKNDIDEKLVALSLGERDEPVEDNEGFVEDAGNFMSEWNNDGDAFPSNLGDMVVDPKSGADDMEKLSYDPSRWTPMEIATATGNANKTVLEHSLNLKSTYTEVEDRSGTRDSNGEPLVTSHNSCFMGTVDYIWRSEGLHTVKVLAPIPKDVMQQSGGFPTKKWGSDHIALASVLEFAK